MEDVAGDVAGVAIGMRDAGFEPGAADVVKDCKDGGETLGIGGVAGAEGVDPTTGIVDVGSHRTMAAEDGRQGRKRRIVDVEGPAVWRRTACHLEQETGRGDSAAAMGNFVAGTSAARLAGSAWSDGSCSSCWSMVDAAIG